jgi:hypothetical protein
MTRQNQRIVRLAQGLDNIATKVHNTFEHIAHELHHADGRPAGTMGDGGSRATDSTTIVERTVITRTTLTNHLTQLDDDMTAIDNIIRSMHHTCDQALRTRTPDKQADRGLCHADPGYAGYLTPLAEGGWFSPTCTNLSRTIKPGLCESCRSRLDRYRERAELKPADDERNIHHDSQTFITDHGVAHTRPIHQQSHTNAPAV